jgi:predicted HicB family RNase H-like nuclease
MTTYVKRGRPPLPFGEGASSHLHMRVTREQKARYVRAAVAEKKKLSEWVTQNLDKASSD